MVRDFHLADLFTLANGFAGTGAIFALIRHVEARETRFFWLASVLLPLALAMDVLDGRIARWRQRASPLGQELDSLADLVSFGVAPAVMAYAIGIDGGWDALGLIFFVACGISRLARYNVTATQIAQAGGPTAKVRYFEGFPIPSSLFLVAGMVVLQATGRTGDAIPLGTFRLGPFLFHPLSLVFVAHGCAMISKTLRIPKP